MDSAIKASPQKIATCRLEDSTSLVVEVLQGDYSLGRIDAEGRSFGNWYRFDDYEHSRFLKQVKRADEDGWNPVKDAPTLQERNGQPYVLTLPRTPLKLERPPVTETVTLSASKDSEISYRLGDSLCEGCGAMVGEIWFIDAEGVGQPRCEDCMAAQLAETMTTHNLYRKSNPSAVRGLLEYADLIKITRMSDGVERVELSRLPHD